MGEFKKTNRFGGTASARGGFGKGGFKKPGFSKGGFKKREFGRGPSRDSSRPLEMHDAVCVQCKKVCQVPFRPNGKKPVFCKDCFVNDKGDTPRTFSRPDSRPAFVPRSAAPAPHAGIQSQIETLNAKLDTLTRLVKELAK